MSELLSDAAARASRYLASRPDVRVSPLAEDVARLDKLGGALPEMPSNPADILALLDDVGSPATVSTTGGRYFGFVIGGSVPAALATSWLAGAWDQNAAFRVMSPVSAKLEEIVIEWMAGLLGLPASCGVGFVTGTTMANFTALAAARTALLNRSGWNVEEQGLFGAPPIQVVVGEEVHVSLLKPLALLGLGRARVTSVPADSQGRMRADALPRFDARTVVCIQAGNVNTGAFDPAKQICERAREAGAWVHVDGAFGLWAAVSPHYSYLLDGFSEADSWAIDCHKWLNVPYDSGAAFVRDAESLRTAMTLSAAYLQSSDKREPCQYTPEASRRARGVELWAALRSLGRYGLADLIERNCRFAKMFADRFRAAGFEVLNDVVLNQLLVSFGSAEENARIVSGVQGEGTCWCGGTQWHGRSAMRISVSSWATTEQDVERSASAIVRVAKSVTSEKVGRR
ncbi:MAG TPA: aminotransferase class V-fold PLP-dependent enzyme [Candidatus Acidoferrum sp.]|nr:aminotransferase class V-fold PLP-dependent enzyme [Candidatus Acidoferrum sp.]